jgi:hypothetical protein
VALCSAAGTALAATTDTSATNSRTTVIYDSTPAPLPGNIVSLGMEATGLKSVGDSIQFTPRSPRMLNNVVATLSSFACVHGGAYNGDCTTPDGATFSQPITLNLYKVGQDGSRGALITSTTQTFNIPYRPSASPNCTGGRWSDGTSCFTGRATQVRFDFTRTVMLPDKVIYEISYNTTHYGPSPIGENTACYHAGNCPYDSLNVGLTTGPTVGHDAPPTLYDPVWKTPVVQFNAGNLGKV